MYWTVWINNQKAQKSIWGDDECYGDSQNNHASSNKKKAREDVEDDEGDMELEKRSKADESGWVISTFSKKVQQSMESFRQKLMKLQVLSHICHLTSR